MRLLSIRINIHDAKSIMQGAGETKIFSRDNILNYIYLAPSKEIKPFKSQLIEVTPFYHYQFYELTGGFQSAHTAFIVEPTKKFIHYLSCLEKEGS